MTGLIYAAIVLAWAAFLVPQWVRRADERAGADTGPAAAARRVLARRRPVTEADDSDSDEPVEVDARDSDARDPEAQGAHAVTKPSRAAGRRAAARRRRVLLLLLGMTMATAALAGLAVLPWLAAVAPVAMVVAFLALCRTQVKRGAVSAAGPSKDVRRAPSLSRRTEGYDPAGDEDTVVLVRESGSGELVSVRPIAHAVDPEDWDEEQLESPGAATGTDGIGAAELAARPGGSLWDPLPMTLPTYVSKPKAPRTIRTIDLSAPGTWTSGRLAAPQAPGVSVDAQRAVV